MPLEASRGVAASKVYKGIRNWIMIKFIVLQDWILLDQNQLIKIQLR